MPIKPAIFVLLIFVGACSSQSGGNGSGAGDPIRVVGHHDLLLSPFSAAIGDQARRKGFQTRGVDGWVSEDGRWSLQGPVRHKGFLCGTYRMGIQIGTGGNACGLVEWSTPLEYGPEHLQCNGATVVHSGAGQSPAFAQQAAGANCVRVVVSCSGNCK